MWCMLLIVCICGFMLSGVLEAIVCLVVSSTTFQALGWFMMCSIENLKCREACKNIFDFTTAGDWDCVAAVKRLPALHNSVDLIFLSFWDHGFHCGTLKLLEGR